MKKLLLRKHVTISDLLVNSKVADILERVTQNKDSIREMFIVYTTARNVVWESANLSDREVVGLVEEVKVAIFSE